LSLTYLNYFCKVKLLVFNKTENQKCQIENKTMSEYFKIGKLAASTGLKGELVLLHNLGKKTSLNFIEAAQIRSDTETIIKLEGIDIMEVARKLTPKEVWLAEDDFKKFAAKSSPIAMLGFMMVNDGEEIGIIEEVIEQPHQILCSIMYNGKEALIPIHEDSLEKLDIKNRKVFVTLPHGLLEIYK
jgi:16S rRNA processing protein RimM